MSNNDDTSLTLTGHGFEYPGVSISARGLVLPEELPYEEWERITEALLKTERSIAWCIGDILRFGERKYGEMYSQALDRLGLDYGTLRNYVWVAKAFPMSERNDNLTWSHHSQAVALKKKDPDAAQRLLEEAEERGWSYRDVRRAANFELFRKDKMLSAGSADLTSLTLAEQKFTVIYADPPWQYEERSVSPNRTIESHYPTMTLEQIKEMNVGGISHDDAVLFLWAPAPMTAHAVDVIREWGFTYRTNIAWDKGEMGMGYYARIQHELLHIAKRGDVPVPLPENRVRSVIHYPAGEHSAKPEPLYSVIERMYPDVPRIELFARARREGWSSFGLEVDERLGKSMREAAD